MRAMVVATEQFRAFGQTGDLVLVAEQCVAVGEWRFHPWLGAGDFHRLDAHTPIATGSFDLAAQRLGDHLVAETNADEFLFARVKFADKILELMNPILIFKNRLARATAYEKIAIINGSGKRPLVNPINY